jgi:hypothetical protein
MMTFICGQRPYALCYNRAAKMSARLMQEGIAMRRFFIPLFAVIASAAPMARGQVPQQVLINQGFVIDGDFSDDYSPYSSRDPMPQMVRNILQMQRENGKDNWAWRDSVENQLVSLGLQAVPTMEAELPERDGYAADAIQVALFRIENAPLVPQEALQEWGEKHFGVSISPEHPTVNPLKISRVMDSHNGAGLYDIFSHHLFYVIECKKTRLVVALAADAKVQPLPDDAAMMRFMQTEAPPQLSVNGKSRLASAAALLMLARNVTPYNPEYRPQNLDTDLRTYKYTLQYEGSHQTASLTFGSNSVLATLSSGQVKPDIDVKPAAPVSAPTSTSPPPLMPE